MMADEDAVANEDVVADEDAMTDEGAGRWLGHSAMSDPGRHAPLVDGLPREIGALCRSVQGLLLHADWCTAYGLEAGHFGPDARTTLPLADRLHRIAEADARPLDAPRPPAARTPGTCRDYALMLCGVLRHRRIPARVRCGFAAYFSQGAPWEDHWICEYRLAGEDRWRRADAQLDDLQRRQLGIAFDITDLPPDMYLGADAAWQRCRTGRDDPARFGHGEARGLWFMRVNVMRDHYAMNDTETSHWDTWRQASGPHLIVGEADRRLTDGIASQPTGSAEMIDPPWRSAA